MRVLSTRIPGVLVIEPERFPDARGLFVETWSRARYAAAGIGADFVQDNLARSKGGVLRGLHVQRGRPQGKLVRVLRGEIFDVAVDVRPGSPTFGAWVGINLDAETHRALWIPEGMAHGYLVLSEEADVLYKVTDVWYPAGERVLRWDDPLVGVDWPLAGRSPILSERDAAGVSLAELAP